MPINQRCAGERRNAWLTGTALMLLLFAAGTSPAVEVEGLYDAQVAMDPNDPDSRDTAYARALDQVLIRITGSEAVATSAEVKVLFPNAARYVLQYRPAEDNSLWVALDGNAIEQVLRARGLPVWGNERPLTVIWLAVDWGRGDRELLQAESSDMPAMRDARAMRREDLRNRLHNVATLRGIPFQLPQADDIKQADISLSDIWGGFHEPLIEVSRRYNAVSVLVGRVRRDDPNRSRWTYYAGGKTQQWNGDVGDAMHLMGDTLAAEFAVSGNEPLSVVELTIDNVDSAAAYAAVQRMVEDLQVIDDHQLKSALGNQLRYTVRINGGARRLSTALDFNSALAPLDVESEIGTPTNPNLLQYVYRP